jgi:hypothetical protein
MRSLSDAELRAIGRGLMADPEMRRVIVREMFGGGMLPITGGTCSTPASEVSSGNFGAACSDTGTYAFSGKVGIGTTSPQGILHINAGSSDVVGNKILIASGSNSYGQVQLGGLSTSEVSLSYIANVTAFGDPPTSSSGSSCIWNQGIGLYTTLSSQYCIANTAYDGPIFLVDSAGGVAIGTYAATAASVHPPDNGLIVSGSVGIGTDAPLMDLDVEPNPDNTFQGVFVNMGGLGTTIAQNQINDFWGNAAFQAQISSGSAYNGANFLGMNGGCPAMDYYTSNSTDGDTQAALTDGVRTYWVFVTGVDGVTTAGIYGAALNAFVDGTVSTGIVPMQWTFQVLNQAGVMIQPLTLRSSGNVGIGRTDRLATLTVQGRASFDATGMVTIAASTSVSGSGTRFTADVGLGDRISVASQTRNVVAIASDTALTVDAAFTTAASGATMTVLPGIFRTDDSDGNPKLIVTNDGRTLLNGIVSLQPLGGTLDDQPQIQAAINNPPSNGGIIMLMPGVYNIGSTIMVSKDGVKLRGYGGCRNDQPGGTSDPLTKLLWKGSAGGTVVQLIPSATNGQIQDLEISNLTIDGAGVVGNTSVGARIGLLLDRAVNSRFISVQVQNIQDINAVVDGLLTVGIGIKLTTTAATGGDNVDCSFNLFENCSILYAPVCLQLTAEPTGGADANSCHNKFIGLSLRYSGTTRDTGIYNTGINLAVCDNNNFDRTWIYTPGSVLYGVIVSDPTEALSNYFYHLELPPAPGPDETGGQLIVFEATSTVLGKNCVFGYDLANGQSQPLAFEGDTDTSTPADPTGYLFWIDALGGIHGD